MEIGLVHICKLFMNSYKPSIDNYWWGTGKHLPHVFEYRCCPKYLEALDNDIIIFCHNLPSDGQTSEVKQFIKNYWLQRGGAKECRNTT